MAPPVQNPPFVSHNPRFMRLAASMTLVVTGGLPWLSAGCQTPAAGIQSFAPEANVDAPAPCSAALNLERDYGGRLSDPRAEDRMRSVMINLAEANGLAHHVGPCRLLRSSTLNAFSLSSGDAYITSGLYALLPRDELLAAVLAHELAHIVAGDSKKPLSSDPARLAREKTADQRAADYMTHAGYDPAALVEAIHLVADVLPADWHDDRLASLAAPSAIADDGPPSD